MKVRSGFVSNSSSSSFIVKLKYISDYALEKMLEEALFNQNEYDAWSFEQEDGYLIGRTDMDNFDAISSLVNYGVPRDVFVEREYLDSEEMKQEADEISTKYEFKKADTSTDFEDDY